jgi:hypothetical protein
VTLRKGILNFIIALGVCLTHGVSHSDHFAGLGLIGVPDNAGPWSWPVDSEFSWISHRFPAATIWHSWRLHPGFDGGILFESEQPPEFLTSRFLMFNIPTTIFSAGNGLTLAGNEDIDMRNLRKKSGQTINDLGSGGGINPIVPLVQDVTTLAAGENGWQLNVDGTYHLVYNTAGNCSGCEMVLHFYGSALPVIADGDINGDGNVTIADVLLAERHSFGMTQLTSGQIARGDLAPPDQGDGILSIADIYRLIRLVGQ